MQRGSALAQDREPQFAWDDLRYFIAVVREGSAQGAARALGVNQTTVARRLTELERELGLNLFERSHEGYRLRADGVQLRAQAERIEEEVAAFASMVAALGRGVQTLRVTTSEPLGNIVIAPALRAFSELWPNVRIDLLIGPQRLDLARGEADIALRAADLPDDPTLIAKRVGDSRWAVYCSKEYDDRFGAPRSADDLKERTLLVIETPSGSYLAGRGQCARIEPRGTLNDLVVALRAGMGVASLPCLVGDGLAGIVRAFAQDEPITPVWLIWHERLRGSPVLRDFVAAVTEAAHTASDRLRGTGSAEPMPRSA